MAENLSPIETLRFFCSQNFLGQAWIESEPLFEAVVAEIGALRADAQRYRLIRQDHEGKLLPDIAMYAGRAMDQYIDDRWEKAQDDGGMPTTAIDEKQLDKLQAHGAAAWGGVDPQSLREGVLEMRNVLSPCALCGEENGFSLEEGSTYRWYKLCCASCGQAVDEIIILADPIAAWNKSGAHAEGLRSEIARLNAMVAEMHDTQSALADTYEPMRQRLQQIAADLAVVLPALGSAAMLCNRRTKAGKTFRNAHDRLAAEVLT